MSWDWWKMARLVPAMPSTAVVAPLSWVAFSSKSRTSLAKCSEARPMMAEVPWKSCVISWIPCEVRSTSCSMSPRLWEISSAATPTLSESLRTSSATTAKPLPASPAWAASMEALRASILVCSATLSMRWTTSLMRSERSFRRATSSVKSTIRWLVVAMPASASVSSSRVSRADSRFSRVELVTWPVTRVMWPMASATSWLVWVICWERAPWRWASAAESEASLVVRVEPTAMERPRRLEVSRMCRMSVAKRL